MLKEGVQLFVYALRHGRPELLGAMRAAAFKTFAESLVDTGLLLLAMIVVVLVLVGAIMLKKEDHED